MRILIVKRGCPFCLQFLKVVNKINLKLPFNSRIRIIDNYEYEEFGLKFFPISDKFETKDFNAYPFCYLDGIVVGEASSELAKSFLEGYLRNEFIIK